MKVIAKSASQKRYESACDAARTWAASCPVESLSTATAERVARSYGIEMRDAAGIISKAKLQRRV